MDANVKKLLADARRRAADVAENAKDAFAGASRTVSEKADEAKLNLELLRLQSESDAVFTQIGYTFYLMNAGKWTDATETAEQRIERLLGEAAEKEMLTTELGHRLADLRGEIDCPACHRSCSDDATFCPSCGARLRPVHAEE